MVSTLRHVRDVAAFIEEKLGAATTVTRWRLLKLVYYTQAWSLVWDGEPLFAEPIEAWDGGPVVRCLWEERKTTADLPMGNPDALSQSQKDTVTEVVRFYARHEGEWLSELTHRERPWIRARQSGGDRNQVISHDEIRSYYALAEMSPKHLTEDYHRGLHLLVNMTPEEAKALLEESGDEDGVNFVRWLETPSA